MGNVSSYTDAISKKSKADIYLQFLSHKILNAPKNNIVYAMAGIPGSGKSTFVQNQIQKGAFPGTAFILNPDSIMEALPEYQQDYKKRGAEKAFHIWELPARELAFNLLEEAIKFHTDIIIDMGAARPEHLNLLQRLKNEGYVLNMYWLNVSAEIAQQRIQNRKRFTPKKMLLEREKTLATLKAHYQALVDNFYV